MINQYVTMDGKKIIDITREKFNGCGWKCLILILEDNTKIRADNLLVERICPKCGKHSKVKFSLRCEKKPWLCQSCNKVGENNPFYGKTHSDEFKKKLSDDRKGKWYLGENNPMYGKPCYYKMTDEEKKTWKDHISAANTGENNPMYGKPCYYKMTDEERTEWREHYMESIRRRYDKTTPEGLANCKKMMELQQKIKDRDPEYYSLIKSKAGKISRSKPIIYKKTKPEMMVEQWLSDHNIEYNYSVIMGDGERNFQYDFIIRHKRILIEVNGDYWHGNPEFFNETGENGKRKLNEVQLEKQKIDAIKAKFAEDHNFKLIYIWEHDIKNGNYSVLEGILNENNIS